MTARTITTPRRFPGLKNGIIAASVGSFALVFLLSACTTTQTVQPEEMHGRRCAYLAPDVCSMLAPVPGKEGTLRYIAPNVDWAQYTKVMVSPVTVWAGAKRKLTAEESQDFANYLYAAVVQQLKTVVPIVDEPGQGVIKVQLALTDAEAAVPVLRTVSMLIPQARVLSTLKYVATGDYPFVGAAQGEFEATDSRTGQLLAAAVDRQIGGGALKTAAQWKWGDVKNVLDEWAKLLATRFAALRAGQTAS